MFSLKQPMKPLPVLAANAFAMFVAALLLSRWGSLPWVSVAHLVFAAAILPLIISAMVYFVPVLTRGREAPRAMQALGLAAWPVGLAAVAGLAWPGGRPWGPALAAAGMLPLLAIFAGWLRRRVGQTLGQPHPCLAWYVAALACLLAALVAVMVMAVWPEQYAALRRLHLHANLLGFVGLTALGTLQVLLPTAAGGPDPQAGLRLRRHLWPSLAGVALVALGAAWMPHLAVPGALFLVWPAGVLARVWLLRRWRTVWVGHGALPLLAAALAGWLLLLVAGAAAGLGLASGGALVPVFVQAFLLPLVTGAVSQLLPVWLRPGAQTPWHGQMRHALGRAGGGRALLFFAGGLLAVLGWESAGRVLSGAGLVLTLGVFVRAGWGHRGCGV